jgi:hypothetical protein
VFVCLFGGVGVRDKLIGSVVKCLAWDGIRLIVHAAAPPHLILLLVRGVLPVHSLEGIRDADVLLHESECASFHLLLLDGLGAAWIAR